VFKFDDNNLAIPVEVLEELDAIKGEQSTERGRMRERVHRILRSFCRIRGPCWRCEAANAARSRHHQSDLVEGNQASPAMQRLRAVLPDL